MAFTFGIKSILSGTPGLQGALGSGLTEHDETLKGTATLETTDSTVEWIETEEQGKRKPLDQRDGETTLTFECANPSLETMAHYLGGEVSEDGKSYSPPAPSEKDPVYLSVKVVTLEGYDIEIPYGLVTAKPLGGTISSGNVMTLEVVVSVMKPSDAETASITYREKENE